MGVRVLEVELVAPASLQRRRQGGFGFHVGAGVFEAARDPDENALVQRSRYTRRGLGEPTAATVAFVAGYLFLTER